MISYKFIIGEKGMGRIRIKKSINANNILIEKCSSFISNVFSSTKTDRLTYIDISKAIAIIIIVVGHTIVHSKHCSAFFNFLYSFNVALFFILSGYTFEIKTNISNFIKKKIVRIVLPYFVWSFLFCIPYLIFGRSIGGTLGTSQSFDLMGLCRNIVYGNGVNNALKQNTSLWFLPALFSMEILYYYIIKIKSSKKYDFVKLMLLIIAGFLYTTFFPYILPWGINTVIEIGGWTFYFGYLLKKNNWLIKIFKPQIIIFFVVVELTITLFNNYSISYVDYVYNNYFLTIIRSVGTSLIVIYVSYMIKNNLLLEYIGRNTMGILIFHKIVVLLFQTKMGIISSVLRNSNLIYEILLATMVTLLSIFFSLVITCFIRKSFPLLIGEYRIMNEQNIKTK